VTGICESVGDATALRLQVLEEIRQVVGFDAYAWLLTDPETAVGASPLAAVPCLPELPRLIRLKYLTDVNRWTTLEAAPVRTLHAATDGDLSRSLLWKGLLARYGVVDMASLVFKDPFGCWGFLDLWRSGTQTPFEPAEAAFLTAVVEPVTTALRRCQANTFALRGSRATRRLGPVVLLLSPDLEVLGQTLETQEYLRVLLPPAPGFAPIPASAYNVAAQLLAVEQEVDANPASARVHLADGLWLTLRAARIGDSGAPGDRNIAIAIEETSPPDRVAVFARAFGLSPRESELLCELATGIDTRELACRMFVSEHTVQDHLKSIFAKTSARNRRTLLARALGT
jgi:DNA-binding CsgD family transcriptional regulator